MTKQQFEIISAELAESFSGGYSDFFEVRIRMSEEFKEAVTSGQLQIRLIDSPYDTDIHDDTPEAYNTKKLAQSIHGYDGFYDWDNSILTIYVDHAHMGKNLSQHPMAEFEKAVTELLSNSSPTPRPPKLG